MMRTFAATVALFSFSLASAQAADEPIPLKPGVRGLVTRSTGPVKIDGKINEWDEAFCTPVHYNHRDLANRPAQFFFMWDDDAFYIGLRALDQKQANPGGENSLWDGDAVEFYLDTRSGDSLRSREWSPGAIHFYFTPFEGKEKKPRFTIRKGLPSSDTKLDGVDHAATSYDWGYEEEFKLPWRTFPQFVPKLGALMAIDAELCSGDGARRQDRTFAYGSPLSVQQPASLGLVQLVKTFDPDYLDTAGPAAFPMWVDTPWTQPERAKVQAVVAIPPEFLELVGEVEIRLHNADGKIVKTLPAPIENFGPKDKGFARAVARWSIDDFAPNTYFASARISARTDKPMVTVTPRMLDEANITGR